jgi:hypothetical protein
MRPDQTGSRRKWISPSRKSLSWARFSMLFHRSLHSGSDGFGESGRPRWVAPTRRTGEHTCPGGFRTFPEALQTSRQGLRPFSEGARPCPGAWGHGRRPSLSGCGPSLNGRRSGRNVRTGCGQAGCRQVGTHPAPCALIPSPCGGRAMRCPLICPPVCRRRARGLN